MMRLIIRVRVERVRNLLVFNNGELTDQLFSRISITLSTTLWQEKIYAGKTAKDGGFGQ